MARSVRQSGASLPAQRTRPDNPLDVALDEFREAVAATAGRGGQPEARLGGPLERLLKRAGKHLGIEAIPYGEVSLRDLRARPDYAVDVGGVRVGYIELKSPDFQRLPPDWNPPKRDREQWEKLKLLPNLVYTNGSEWRLFHFGELSSPTVRVNKSARRKASPTGAASAEFEHVIRNFLLWEPESPRSLRDLIKTTAGLCRLLRDEVAVTLRSPAVTPGREDLELLAAEWRDLLFPDLNDSRFSDAYAQTVTFAMLLAQINGVDLASLPLHEVGRQLGKKHALIGRAFSILTDSEATSELSTVDTLRRVIAVVDWSQLDDGHTDVYVQLYERFLEEYDPALRQESGTYYTPEPVARFMVEFVNQVLVTRLGLPRGFASDEVVTIDPAMGTGSFLVEIVRSVADTIGRLQGAGARPARLRELFRNRLVGFEKQVAPYAVAELRLHEALKTRFGTDIPSKDVRFLTDALEDPSSQPLTLTAGRKTLGRAKSEANRFKRDVRVTVVIGNPPHLGDAKRLAPWVAEPRRTPVLPGRSLERPAISDFKAPGKGSYESDLHGLHWYFWRWGLWKVFDAHEDHRSGVVAFITPSSYMTGKAFSGMRSYLRRTCDEGWVIDVSPEKNRSDPKTRFFAGVQRRLAIGVFVRHKTARRRGAGKIHFISIAGSREDKYERLAALTPDDSGWKDADEETDVSFLPTNDKSWHTYPSLQELMPWGSRGVTTGRGWTYAPDVETLERRWSDLIAAGPSLRATLFKERSDRKLSTVVEPLPGFPSAHKTIGSESGPLPTPIQAGYRSFDRQWIIPDNRLMERPRPPLWALRSDRQVYVTEQNSHEIDSGPGLTFTALVPDLHHYNVRSGRAAPLFRDPEAKTPNITPGLLRFIASRTGRRISANDFLAYMAGIVAHPAFTACFKEDLKEPGIRVPLSGRGELWERAIQVGREVLWLHTYGTRGKSSRARNLPRLVEQIGPKVIEAIPDTPEAMPERFNYAADGASLHVGTGLLRPVSPEVVAYDVAGFHVLNAWLDRRMRKPRHKRKTSPLDDINCQRWTPQLTDELIELVTVLQACIDLEPRQADLLGQVLDSPLISTGELHEAGILPPPEWATREPDFDHRDPQLF